MNRYLLFTRSGAAYSVAANYSRDAIAKVETFSREYNNNMSATLETVTQTMELTAHEKTSLARFAPAIRHNDALRAEVELFAALPAGSRVPLVAFDRVMRAFRAWLVFGTFE